MARKYRRDNRGRFAGGGGGATARGGRLKTASGKKRKTQTMKAKGPAKAGAMKGKVKRDPGAMAKMGKAKAKAAPKVQGTLSAVAARRKRATSPKNSTYLSQKLNTRSSIVRSAANAIYNRQRAGAKSLFGGKVPSSILRDPIGILPGLSGSKRNRASQNLEAARKRVVAGRRGRR